MFKNNYIFIVEGADATGKNELCNYIAKYNDGKVHILHSNCRKDLPKQNNYRQHKLMTNFVIKQFSKNYFTGNNVVIFNRNYISDLIYSNIGYGSKSSSNIKRIKKFKSIINDLLKINNITLCFIYCNPKKSSFNPGVRDELLDYNENYIIINEYEKFFNSRLIKEILKQNRNIKLYKFNFNTDSNYVNLKTFLDSLEEEQCGINLLRINQKQKAGIYVLSENDDQRYVTVLYWNLSTECFIDNLRFDVFNKYKAYNGFDKRIYIDSLCNKTNNVVAWKNLCKPYMKGLVEQL